jgi:hypothetical protein
VYVFKVAEAAVTALEISTSGGVLGVGTSEGEAIAVSTPGLSAVQRVKNAHMVFVTAAAVAPDGSALLTVRRPKPGPKPHLITLGMTFK